MRIGTALRYIMKSRRPRLVIIKMYIYKKRSRQGLRRMINAACNNALARTTEDVVYFPQTQTVWV